VEESRKGFKLLWATKRVIGKRERRYQSRGLKGFKVCEVDTSSKDTSRTGVKDRVEHISGNEKKRACFERSSGRNLLLL